MKKTFLLTILAAFLACSCNNQKTTNAQLKNTINFHLDGIQYDSLLIVGRDNNDKAVRIRGEQKDKGLWSFHIPDSVLNILPSFEVRSKSLDAASKTGYMISFQGVMNGDTTSVGYFNIDEKHPTIYAKYNGQTSFDNLASYEKDGKRVSGEIHFIVDKFLIQDYDSSSDVSLKIREPFFSYFWDLKQKGKKYDDFIRDYTAMAAGHPDSRYLITNLSQNLFNYKSNDDIMKIYGNLSAKYKKTPWGENIERYMNGKFGNAVLPSEETGQPEAIIQDTTKHCLIIFSASWCKYCREEIPLLKKINKDLKGKLDMVYVTIDEQTSVDQWGKMMQEEQIPWRSVLATGKTKAIRQQYYVGGIPQSILAYPGGKMEIMDLRDKANEEKLYRIIQGRI